MTELSELWSLVKLWLLVFVAYVRILYRRVFPEKKQVPPIWKIRKVLLLRDDHDDFLDITKWFIPDDEWKKDIEERFPEWKDWKVEVRCTYGHKKCRIVLRPHDDFTWPPRTEPQLNHTFHTLQAPHGILSATLIPAEGVQSKSVDITARLRKYAGFGNDYHGTQVKVRDIFPMDDHDDNQERFSGIRVIQLGLNTGLSVRTYSYRENEELQRKIKSS